MKFDHNLEIMSCKRLMARVLPVFCFFLLVFGASCSSSNEGNERTEESRAEVNINGITSTVESNGISGNENCNTIFLELSANATGQLQGYRLRFEIAKNGALQRVSYREFNNSGSSLFLTPNFNPVSSFTLTNFIYNAALGYLEFDFNGTLFLEGNSTVNKTLSGHVKVKNFTSAPCQIGLKGLTYDSNELRLHSFAYIVTTFNLNSNQIHKFYSNNGYKMYINLSSDLWNFSSNEIHFGDNDSNDNVDFYAYIGPLLADQLQQVNPSDWKKYTTSGTLFIDNKYIENGDKMISGRINLTVKENGSIIYMLNGVAFRIKSMD